MFPDDGCMAIEGGHRSPKYAPCTLRLFCIFNWLIMPTVDGEGMMYSGSLSMLPFSVR